MWKTSKDVKRNAIYVIGNVSSGTGKTELAMRRWQHVLWNPAFFGGTAAETAEPEETGVGKTADTFAQQFAKRSEWRADTVSA